MSTFSRYTPELRQRMLAAVSGAYDATERGTLSPAKRDAIERGLATARQNEMPEDQLAAVCGAFEREIAAARDEAPAASEPFAADIFE